MLLVVSCLPCVGRGVPCDVCCLLPGACCLLYVVCRLLLLGVKVCLCGVWRSLFVVPCSFVRFVLLLVDYFVVCCLIVVVWVLLLFVICCLLLCGFCALFVVHGSLSAVR